MPALQQQIANPFRHCKPPPWASAWGQDKYGFFADFSVATGPMYWDCVAQRMRWVPPGTFLMGSPEDEWARNENEVQHEVTLTAGFWLADTTCRQELWNAVMQDNPSHFPGDLLPVENVDYDQVHEFFARVAEIVPGLQLQLPTEAQWEYACRAGTQTPFSFGDDITPEQVNYDGNYPYRDGTKGEYRETTVACDSLPANDWGLFQMHGNVWEWCRDWHGPYDVTGHVVDPVGPKEGSDRVIRGGSWFSYARYARSASRYGYGPGSRWSLRGVRCMSSVKQ